MRFFSNYCNNDVRLMGKTVIITGANCGIGKETARDIYRRGKNIYTIYVIDMIYNSFI